MEYYSKIFIYQQSTGGKPRRKLIETSKVVVPSPHSANLFNKLSKYKLLTAKMMNLKRVK